MRRKTVWQKSPCRAAGAVITEALFTIPILVLLGAGMIDFAIILRENAVVVSAARAGARAAAGATFSDGENYDSGEVASDGTPLSGVGVFLCVLAKQSAKKFLSEAGLNPTDFRIQVAAAQLAAGEDEDGNPIFVDAASVTVSHADPRWYFMWRNAARVSSTSVFATESRTAPEDCDGVATP